MSFRILPILFALYASSLGPTPALARTLTVTSGSDSGPGTLRQAIADSRYPDTITFAAWVRTIELTSDSLGIDGPLRIIGPNEGQLTIRRSSSSGTPPFRIFEISSGVVTLSGLTITNGISPGGLGGPDGGGIWNASGDLTLINCIVSGNSAPAGSGGGIINPGRITIINSTIEGNSAPTGQGGGIYNIGGMSISNSTVSGNMAAEGAGIFTRSTTYTRTVIDSTVTGNNASRLGGGIYDAQGGTSLKNSILALNSAPTGPDAAGQINSLGFNLIGSVVGATYADVSSDRVGVTTADLRLGPLQQNGGGTTTHALLPGSIAIDTGRATPDVTDQRGFARWVDSSSIPNNIVGGDGSDVGAYEVQADLLPGCNAIDRVVSNGNDGGAGSLREILGNVCNGTTIAISPSVATITLTSGELLLGKSVTILGHGSATLLIQRSPAAGTPTFRVFNVLSSGVRASFKGMTISNGDALLANGGGINLYLGHAELEDVVITGNHALYGGGIYSYLGSLELSRVVTSNNSAANSGGGIYQSNGELVVLESSFVGNTATYGAGIYHDGGRFEIRDSALTGNAASVAGGGMYNDSMVDALLTNVTISGNIAAGTTGDGGGIENFGSLELINCTVAGNSSAQHGGGIDHFPGKTFLVRNSIIALNSSALGPDVDGALTSQGFNLIGTSSGATISPLQSSDQVGVTSAQLNLGPLKNNSGFTPTRALRVGSVAIDQGHSGGFKSDQRGLHRPIDQLDVPNVAGGDGADIGAYEYLPEPDFLPGGLFLLMALGPLGRRRESGRDRRR